MCSAVWPIDQHSGAGFQYHCGSLTSIEERYSFAEFLSICTTSARSSLVIGFQAARRLNIDATTGASRMARARIAGRFASWAFLLFVFAPIRSTFPHQNDVPSITDRHLDWPFFRLSPFGAADLSVGGWRSSCFPGLRARPFGDGPASP